MSEVKAEVEVVSSEVESDNTEEVEKSVDVKSTLSDKPSKKGDFNGIQIESLMNNPDMVAALQNQMYSMVGTNSGYIDNLPSEVKRRVKALKKMQFDIFHVEAEFYQRVRAIEYEFQEKYNIYYDKRCSIINGSKEPTDSDCDWSSDEDEEDASTPQIKEISEGDEEKPASEPVSGIPEFWLTTFKNVEFLNDMVQETDYPVLKHLIDIKCELHKLPKNGFDLNFIFEKNEYFENLILKKSYDLRIGPVKEDGYNYEGPEIFATKGCDILWYPNKNVTVKTIKKIVKTKSNAEPKRTVNKLVNVDSFFNYFNPPEAGEGNEELDEDLQGLLSADFEIGHFISERLIQRAVLYFTGDAISDDEDEEDEDDEDEDDEEYNEEDDEDYTPEDKSAKCKQQ